MTESIDLKGTITNRFRALVKQPDRRKFERHIGEHLEGKSVLDIGCVQHRSSQAKNEGWMHELIAECASSVLGVDILEEDLAELQSQGYNVLYGDAEDLDLNQEFEVVFLGEVIEHLSDFEGLFNSVDDCLKPGGRVIITTPNAMSAYWLVNRLAKTEFINPEHTCWFDETTLRQLLRRFGFEVVECNYARMSRVWSIRSLVGAMGWSVELALPPRIAHRNLIVVAKRADEEPTTHST